MNKILAEKHPEESEILFLNTENIYFKTLNYFFLYLSDKKGEYIPTDIIQKNEELGNTILDIYSNDLPIDIEFIDTELMKKGYHIQEEFDIKDFGKIFENNHDLFKAICSGGVLLAFTPNLKKIFLVVNVFGYSDLVREIIN